MKKPAVQIVYRKTADMEKLGGNPRYIYDDDMARLKQSIKDNPDYFECRPIILSDRTGSLVIIAGNMRYEAARQLGMEEVPTVLMHGLSENREKEIVIRDNISNGRWDYDILANENWGTTEELGEWGLDISFMGNGEEEGNLDNFFEDAKDAKENEKEKDLVVTVTIPYEEADIEEDVRNKIIAALLSYPNVSVK